MCAFVVVGSTYAFCKKTQAGGSFFCYQCDTKMQEACIGSQITYPTGKWAKTGKRATATNMVHTLEILNRDPTKQRSRKRRGG